MALSSNFFHPPGDVLRYDSSRKTTVTWYLFITGKDMSSTVSTYPPGYRLSAGDSNNACVSCWSSVTDYFTVTANVAELNTFYVD
ncbi:hypothetical protein L798_08517 [Zootermopsis nevadensis]|uniref:Uncharacterized protein n=1 Tax=Zootermopsis nevadensis TaxID=136037 RepID=A0A067R2T6_ZOONE|nr:hypothetical protein L798_08517 [Zootermopsis nevadensis]